MPQFETIEPGTMAIITQTAEGRIVQIALTAEQSSVVQIFLASLSREKAFIQMPEEYDLVLKRER